MNKAVIEVTYREIGSGDNIEVTMPDGSIAVYPRPVFESLMKPIESAPAEKEPAGKK